MESFFHSVKLDSGLCVGCTNCVKRCPTAAIRVQDGKAHILRELCIDCGQCIYICPHHAKSAVVDHLADANRVRYTMALPAPSLYGQFHHLTDPAPVIRGLYGLGFDAVYEVARGAEAVTRLTQQYLDEKKTAPAGDQLCLSGGGAADPYPVPQSHRKYPAHSAAGGSGGTACQTGFLPENRLPA